MLATVIISILLIALTLWINREEWFSHTKKKEPANVSTTTSTTATTAAAPSKEKKRKSGRWLGWIMFAVLVLAIGIFWSYHPEEVRSKAAAIASSEKIIIASPEGWSDLIDIPRSHYRMESQEGCYEIRNEATGEILGECPDSDKSRGFKERPRQVRIRSLEETEVRVRLFPFSN